MNFLRTLFNLPASMRIDSRQSLEDAAVFYGILPFFSNPVKGFSVESMTVPGLLFGGNIDEGCWEWKGPVIRKRTTAYGKFFRRKAGFVARDILPDFLNYRRHAYPVVQDSTEEILLEIIRENDGMTSTELKANIFGDPFFKRNWDDLPDSQMVSSGKRKSLEGPLQRLQMGGWLVISDFEYKKTKTGERYGWGVARYSTPELVFGREIIQCDVSPEESLQRIVDHVIERRPGTSKTPLLTILR